MAASDRERVTIELKVLIDSVMYRVITTARTKIEPYARCEYNPMSVIRAQKNLK